MAIWENGVVADLLFFMQCTSCFRRSNHIGHEVFFHKSSIGGCCDCGDLEAWAEEGSCPDHVPLPLLGNTEDKDVDPVSFLPPTLVKSASIVICEVIRYVNSVAWDCSISYEATPNKLHGMSKAVDHSSSRKRRIGVEVGQSPRGRDTEEPASSPSPGDLNQDHICVRWVGRVSIRIIEDFSCLALSLVSDTHSQQATQ